MLFVAAIAAMLSANTSASRATEGPWCSWITIGGDGNGVENCSLRSYEMCRQEITGGDRGSCYPNARFGGGNGTGHSHRTRY
jgi:hypothetical protein